MATIKRGVSLYSYQQSQFFKELTLEDQVREVGTNLDGADGIAWDVSADGRLPHEDHLEMSGRYAATVVRYGVDAELDFVGVAVAQMRPRDDLGLDRVAAKSLRHRTRQRGRDIAGGVLMRSSVKATRPNHSSSGQRVHTDLIKAGRAGNCQPYQ